MSTYTFTFKKDDIFVEFTTTDKDIVENQFQIWVADADNYMRNPHKYAAKKVAKPVQEPVKETPSPEVKAEPVITNSAQEDVPQSAPQQAEEQVVENSEIKQEENIDVQTTEEIAQPEAATKAEEIESEVKQESEQPEVFDKASTLLKTINTIQNPAMEENAPAGNGNFEAVLEKEIENPTFEPNRPKDQVFLNLMKSKKTQDKFHYLIITSYYLSEFEKMERFSLKQINTKLMQNLSEVIDHAMLQDAINQGLIELVPDLTGTSEVGEYTITRLGEEFFANQI